MFPHKLLFILMLRSLTHSAVARSAPLPEVFEPPRYSISVRSAGFYHGIRSLRVGEEGAFGLRYVLICDRPFFHVIGRNWSRCTE